MSVRASLIAKPRAYRAPAVGIAAGRPTPGAASARAPGSGNRPHWHKDFDEWWVIMAGRIQWELTGGTKIEAGKDELVWVPRGTVHHITNIGTEMSLRMAVAMPPAVHYYSPCEQCGYADDGPRAFW